MELIHDSAQMQERAGVLRASGRRLSVVPTMGALHEGHLVLIRTAKKHSDVVITTVFVNPTQFGQGEDFERYPRDLERDAALASGAGTDILFAPDAAAMYPPGYSTFVEVGGPGDVLEGRCRPGHFRGVATVVTKLFNITAPHVAVFGQKDAQQAVIVRRLIRDLDMPVGLIVVPTVREPDGLAMSSRNAYLTAGQRKEAPVLFESLRRAEQSIGRGERRAATIVAETKAFIREHSSGAVDYVSVADAESLDEVGMCPSGAVLLISLAVRFGATRLIDNITVTIP